MSLASAMPAPQAGAGLADTILAALTPNGRSLAESTRSSGTLELYRLLEASGVESFWITSQAMEDCWDIVLRQLDASRDAKGNGIVHNLCSQPVKGSIASTLRRVLALGLHPDEESSSEHRPSHLCSSDAGGHSSRAEILCSCRPDLTALTMLYGIDGYTPAEKAKLHLKYVVDGSPEHHSLQKVVDIWESALQNGFKSLAQLACEEKYFAVKNLCRRRFVSFQEVCETYRGLDVVQWAEHRGQHKLAEEIRYLFKYPQQAKIGVGLTPGESPSTLAEMVALSSMKLSDLVEEKFAKLTADLDVKESSVKSDVLGATQSKSSFDVGASGKPSSSVLRAMCTEIQDLAAGTRGEHDVVLKLSSILRDLKLGADGPQPK